MSEISDEKWQKAKDDLSRAIMEWHRVCEPDMIPVSWVLVTNKESVELARENQSAVGILVPTGQSFVTTAGLLKVAAET